MLVLRTVLAISEGKHELVEKPTFRQISGKFFVDRERPKRDRLRCRNDAPHSGGSSGSIAS